MPPVDFDSWEQLSAAAAALATGSQRHILGLTGPPGAGKSTLAKYLVSALTARGNQVALVGMDGFHLADIELARLGRQERKGAPDTFDVRGYISLMRRLRARDEAVVYAPEFDRLLEASIAGAVPIPREVSLIVTEGNYLLVQAEFWSDLRLLLDECWYVELDDEVRRQRLIARHVSYGRDQEQARERAEGSDERNARLVRETRRLADRIVTVPELPR